MGITFLSDPAGAGYCYVNSGVCLPGPYEYMNLVFF